MEQSTLNTDNLELLSYASDQLTIDILGGIKLTGLDRLRTTLKLSKNDESTFPLRYSVDLYHADQTEKLIRRGADHFDLDISYLRKLIMGLIEALEKFRVAKNKEYYKPKRQTVILSQEEEKAAIKYLKQKDLLQKMMSDIGKAGVIGEEINRLLMYLVFTSRKLTNPLHIISLGPSGVGKSHLQNSVAALIPEEDVINITTLTKNSLYYFDSDQLQHSLIAIEDMDGASEESLYAIRELQSRKQLSKTTTVKDSKGNLSTNTILVKGIVSVAATTTKENVYEDNSNRSILIHIDTSKRQDKAIINYQKQLASNSIDKLAQGDIKKLFKDTQRILKPVKVVNTLSNKLSLPKSVYNPRRTMAIYLSVIEAITFIHQYQRTQKEDEEGNPIIETTEEDIKWAKLLLKKVFLNKSDNLTGGCRTFLAELRTYLGTKKIFTTKELKKGIQVPSATLQRYLKELEANGNLQTKGSRYSGFEYEVVDDGFEEVEHEIETFSNSQ